VRYFTSFGPQSGVLTYSAALGAIPVLLHPGALMPVGMALAAGRDAAGRALWTLSVHDGDLPGRWLVVDREFVPAR
jgi:hypothetical protein